MPAGAGKRSFASGLSGKGTAEQRRKEASSAVKESSLLVGHVG